MNTDDIKIGQIVISKSGRDKGERFLVMRIEDEYLYLADGKLRPLEKPKKKKRMHVAKTNMIAGEIAEKLAFGARMTNSDLKKALKLEVNQDNVR